MSRRKCLELLTPRFPALDFATVSEINARVFALLPSRQRWLLSTRAVARPASYASVADEDTGGPACGVADPDPLPEEVVASLQERRRLQQALSELPADERLMLRLHYEQGLTLAEVARLTGQPDAFRVHRRIRAALDRLAALLSDPGTARGAKITSE
jgi:RNA polymerase sigma factor (sigma-70 family)